MGGVLRLGQDREREKRSVCVQQSKHPARDGEKWGWELRRDDDEVGGLVVAELAEEVEREEDHGGGDPLEEEEGPKRGRKSSP